MRILALAILAVGMVSIGPAASQTYDPGYPVCLHDYRHTITNALHVLHSARVGIRTRGTVCHQSIFRGRARARGLSTASPVY